MIKDTIWFDLSLENEVDIIFNFAETLPQKIKEILKPENSNFYKKLNLIKGLNEQTFDLAFKESELILYSDIEKKRANLRKPKSKYNYRKRYITKIKNIGFDSNGLKLKANLLNILWNKFRDVTDGIINFSNNSIIKTFRNFLSFLNTILDSLTEFFLGLEPFKEIKECIEAILTIFED